MADPFTLLLLGVGGVAGLVLLDRFMSNPEWVAGAVALSVVVETFVSLPSLSLGPVNVFVSDLLLLAIAVATFGRLLRKTRLRAPLPALLALVALAGFSLARGVAEFGLQTAVNQARGVLPFLVTTVYVATISDPFAYLRRFRFLWISLAAIMSALAIARWTATAAGVNAGTVLEPSASQGRMLAASAVLLIAQGFFVLLMTQAGVGRSARRERVLLILLFAVAVLLRHRTVWVILIAGAGIVVWLSRRIRRRLLAVLALAGLVGAAIALTWGGEAPTGQLDDTATRTNTLEWRVEGWTSLISQPRAREATAVLVGQPFGTGYAREINGQQVTVSPHNFYILAYLRFGLLGLAMLAAIVRSILPRLVRRASRSEGGWPTVELLLLSSLLIYSFSYTPGIEQGLVFGYILAMSAATKRQSVYSRRAARVHG